MAVNNTPFESSGETMWTPYMGGESFLQQLEAYSNRVSLISLGASVEGRHITGALIGYPSPDVSKNIVMIVAEQHGQEVAGREGCFKLIRDLAETNDEVVTSYLNRTTFLIVPTVNPDRLFIQRGNANNVDINRTYHTLSQPESYAVMSAIKQYKPVVIIDAHEGRNFPKDVATFAPDNPAIDAGIVNVSELLRLHIDDAVVASDRTVQIYPTEGILGPEYLSTSGGLNYAITIVLETRRTDNDSNPPPKSRVDDYMTCLDAVIDYHQNNEELVYRTTYSARHGETDIEDDNVVVGASGEVFAPELIKVLSGGLVVEPACLKVLSGGAPVIVWGRNE